VAAAAHRRQLKAANASAQQYHAQYQLAANGENRLWRSIGVSAKISAGVAAAIGESWRG
jgi:hypothetical protein